MKRTDLFTLAALAFCMLASQNATAQSDFGPKSLGVAVGYVSPENLDGTMSIGAFLDLGTVAPRFGMEAHLDHWSESQSAFGTEASVSDLNLGARGKYFIPVSSAKVQPFFGAGLGLHFVSAKVTIPAFGSQPEMSVKESSTKLGLDLGGGMSTSLSPRMDLRTELWYGAASDVNQLSLRVGMGWKLGS